MTTSPSEVPQCFRARTKSLISGWGGPYKGCRSASLRKRPCRNWHTLQRLLASCHEIFDSGVGAPLQRAPQRFLADAKLFILCVCTPYKRRRSASLRKRILYLGGCQPIQRLWRATLPKPSIFDMGSPLQRMLASCHDIVGVGCWHTVTQPLQNAPKRVLAEAIIFIAKAAPLTKGAEAQRFWCRVLAHLVKGHRGASLRGRHV